MEDLDVDLLDAVGVLSSSHPYLLIDHPGQKSARFPGEPNHFHALPHGSFGRLDDIHGVAAGAYGQKYIAFLPYALHIPGENLIKTVIVGRTGDV